MLCPSRKSDDIVRISLIGFETFTINSWQWTFSFLKYSVKIVEFRLSADKMVLLISHYIIYTKLAKRAKRVNEWERRYFSLWAKSLGFVRSILRPNSKENVRAGCNGTDTRPRPEFYAATLVTTRRTRLIDWFCLFRKNMKVWSIVQLCVSYSHLTWYNVEDETSF